MERNEQSNNRICFVNDRTDDAGTDGGTGSAASSHIKDWAKVEDATVTFIHSS